MQDYKQTRDLTSTPTSSMNDTSSGLSMVSRVPAKAHQEGPIAKTIEHQTAKIPSDTFLWAALGSIAISALLQFRKKQELSNFVGQWAPTILILGLYNKLVKVAGSDQQETAAAKL